MSPIPGWSALRARWSAVAPRRKAVLALLLVFAAGLAGGALIEDLVDEIDRPLFAAEDHDSDDEDDLTEETLLANLDLTPDQWAGIERVFESREDRLEAYWDSRLPELEAVIDSSREEIRQILTPAQRAAYDSQLTRLRMHPRRQLEEDDDD
jgi:Spy/CpxP family protein refolding chaperone